MSARLEERPVLRVLCVDDQDDNELLLRRALKSLDRPYALERARTYEDARELLLSRHFCIAFLDLVLDPQHEVDHDDWEGLRLLEDIADMGLTSQLVVVIVTQFPRFDDARWAFIKHHVADYVVKSTFEDLQQKVEGVVGRHNAFGLDCDVELLDGLQWSTLLDRISRGRLQSLGSPISLDAALEEMDHLLRRLFDRSHALQVSSLPGGRTPTAVIRVERLTEGHVVSPAVVKIGEVSQIERERQGFESVSDYLSGMRSTRLEDFRRGVYLGAIRYSLIGGGGRRLTPFLQYYLEAETRQVQQTLTGLFEVTCGLFYEPRNRVPAGNLDLVARYRDTLGLDASKLERGYEFKFGHLLTDRRAFVHHQLDVELPNAVLEFHRGQVQYAADSFVCPTHGDLHGDNVVVDRDDGGAWLIDFGSAGSGHWARDFALLECDLHYRIVQSSDLADLYSFEQSLLATGSLGVAPNFGGLLDGELRRAGQVIATLRELAGAASRRHPTAFVEYQVALLMTTLLYMQFHALLNRKWRKWQVMMTAGCLLELIRARSGRA